MAIRGDHQDIQRFQRPNQHAIRNGIVAALQGALVNVAQNTIEQVANDIIHQIERQGANAQGVIRQQLYSIARATGQSTSTAWNALRNAIPDWNQAQQTLTNGLERASNSLAELTTDLQGNIQAHNTGTIQVRPGDQPFQGWEPMRPGHNSAITRFDDNHRRPTPAERSNMEDTGTTVAAAAASSSSSTTVSSVSKETPISLTQPSYGLQETHTAILPWTGWLTAAGMDKGTAVQLKLRMNTPYDMIDVTTQTTPAAGQALSTKGFYVTPCDSTGRYNDQAGFASQYPEQFTQTTTQTAEAPAWRDYWSQLYEYYTVLGCEYDIILYNPVHANMQEAVALAAFNSSNTLTADGYLGLSGPCKANTDCVCAVQYDTYTDTAGASGNVMPAARYSAMRAFKNIKWVPIPGGQKAVISGTYKPGQAKRNIVNDGDVKTWTTTTAANAIPALKEILTLNFFADPFYNGHLQPNYGTSNIPTTMGGAVYPVVMMEINLKYIVQYKDLKQLARYPNVSAGTTITNIISTTLADTGNPNQHWAT
jgi:hypothetical protein